MKVRVERIRGGRRLLDLEYIQTRPRCELDGERTHGRWVRVSYLDGRDVSAEMGSRWCSAGTAWGSANVLAWIAVKRTWGLTMDQAEADAIEVVLAGCP